MAYALPSLSPRFQPPEVEFGQGQGFDQLAAQVRGLKETNARLTTQVADLNRKLAQVGGLQQQVTQLQTQAKTLTTERETARAALAPTQKERDDLKAQVAGVQSSLSGAKQALDQANRARDTAIQNANAANGQIDGYKRAAEAAATEQAQEKARAGTQAQQINSLNQRSANAESTVSALRTQINGMVPRGELENANASLNALRASSVPKGDHDQAVRNANQLREQVGQAQALQQAYNRLLAEVRGLANLTPPADGWKTEGGLTAAIWGTLGDAKKRLDETRAAQATLDSRLARLESFVNEIEKILKEG